MIDKGLDKLLNCIFGLGGITILILTWVQPMPASDRILAISVGSIGFLWVLTRVVLLRFKPAKI